MVYPPILIFNPLLHWGWCEYTVAFIIVANAAMLLGELSFTTSGGIPECRWGKPISVQMRPETEMRGYQLLFRCINYIAVDEVGIACILYNVPFAGF